MAELADALDSGSSEGNFMEVQVLSTAPINTLCGSGGMADALASGASDGNIMEVQVLSTAPSKIFILYHAVVAELADALL